MYGVARKGSSDMARGDVGTYNVFCSMPDMVWDDNRGLVGEPSAGISYSTSSEALVPNPKFWIPETRTYFNAASRVWPNAIPKRKVPERYT